MSLSLNKVTLIGNLGKDPEIRTFQSGDRVANFSVATSERWTDKGTGEEKEKTQWHNIVVMNQHIVKVVERYLKKGMKVYVEGQLETRKWTDQSGTDKYVTEVVLRFNSQLIILTPIDKQNTAQHDDRRYKPSDAGQSSYASSGSYASAPVDALEDEIPF